MLNFSEACQPMPLSDIGVIKNVITDNRQVRIEYEALTLKHIDVYNPGTLKDNNEIIVIATLNDDTEIPIHFSDIEGGMITIHQQDRSFEPFEEKS